jgi:hypothetical protein
MLVLAEQVEAAVQTQARQETSMFSSLTLKPVLQAPVVVALDYSARVLTVLGAQAQHRPTQAQAGEVLVAVALPVLMHRLRLPMLALVEITVVAVAVAMPRQTVPTFLVQQVGKVLLALSGALVVRSHQLEQETCNVD